MPKGKRKGRSDRVTRNGDSGLQTSDEDSYADNMSVMSNYSENTTDDTEECDEFTQDQIEDKLSDIIDGLTQKSSQGRTNCLKTFTKGLVKKYMPGFIRDRNYTLCDCIEKSLKKGGSAEKAAAAELAAVMCVQLGAEGTSEEICQMLKPVLLTTACDNSAAASVRATCCTTLSELAFLSGGEIGETITLMHQFETIFSGSYLKGDGNIPTISPDVGNLHAAALNSWSLLFTLLVPGSIGTMITNSKSLPSLHRLAELLQSVHLEVRLAAGEALALVYESGRMENDTFFEDFALEVSEILKQLATDSHKYRAKKERKVQRATFRDILQFIEEDMLTEVKVKFGKEVLVLDTWAKRKQYDSLCSILGPGINVHLSENSLLREIFGLGSALLEDNINPKYAQNQMERYRKRLLNAANYKARTISRAKNRDKRSDF